MLVAGCATSKQEDGQVLDQLEQSSPARRQSNRGDEGRAKQIIDHLAENLRYCRYWFGTTDIDDVYEEGKQISALIFWTRTGRPSRVGFCSTDLSRCIATSGARLSPEITQKPIDRDLTPRAAFESFVNSGIDGNTLKLFPRIEPRPAPIEPTPAPIAPPTGNADLTIPAIPRGYGFPLPERLKLADFEFEEKSITMPPLGLPNSISRRVIPGEAPREAKRLRREFVCWEVDNKRPPGCTGSLAFAYYNEADPYWFVLRTCSPACPSRFRGESIQFLTRRVWGWAVTSGGHMNSPKDEVARFKQKIEQAEMFRFKLP